MASHAAVAAHISVTAPGAVMTVLYDTLKLTTDPVIVIACPCSHIARLGASHLAPALRRVSEGWSRPRRVMRWDGRLVLAIVALVCYSPLATTQNVFFVFVAWWGDPMTVFGAGLGQDSRAEAISIIF